MKQEYISTREIAELLNVTETTVKRWTDSGRLKCTKTLGGHRKYTLKDVENFSKENNIPISGIVLPSGIADMEQVGFALFNRKLETIADLLKDKALKGDRTGIFDLLMYLTKNRIRFSEIVDEIIQPAMKSIGDQWEKKKIDVEQEHLASGAVRTALARLIVYLPHQRKRNTKILCTCVEGEIHDLGLQLIGYELELGGYDIHYLGANTPFKSTLNAIKREKPDWVLLSATTPTLSESEVMKGVGKIVNITKEMKSQIILGGSYMQKLKQEFKEEHIAGSLRETISIIKTKTKKNERIK